MSGVSAKSPIPCPRLLVAALRSGVKGGELLYQSMGGTPLKPYPTQTLSPVGLVLPFRVGDLGKRSNTKCVRAAATPE